MSYLHTFSDRSANEELKGGVEEIRCQLEKVTLSLQEEAKRNEEERQRNEEERRRNEEERQRHQGTKNSLLFMLGRLLGMNKFTVTQRWILSDPGHLKVFT